MNFSRFGCYIKKSVYSFCNRFNDSVYSNLLMTSWTAIRVVLKVILFCDFFNFHSFSFFVLFVFLSKGYKAF